MTGGGSVLASLSRELRVYAEGIGGREQMAIEAFASALEVIPRTLSKTLDWIQLPQSLNSERHMQMAKNTQESMCMRVE